ncbi:oxysterol-binding protein 1-like isoform X5 [Pomacea canaliculata]|uniref:oxysterol-binding protein 1-like isoform X5 n=1 Tax=Pomacea canaliculata TaxID=400727 RepID=UPI000D7375DE|nr:oxysterol-binding protein 1-like isoform X5 [Pomacea canaliculata]
MSDSKHQSMYKGWLYKWTNYLKGYQKRWFVLQNGLLSYYRNQAEMAHTCRGTINLASALIHTEDSTTIIISNGGAQTFHLKATSEVERQKWVTALELAKSEAIKMLEAVLLVDSESDEEERQQPDKNELQLMVRTLASKLEDLNTCNDLIAKHGNALQKTLSELEQVDDPADAASKLKAVNERATLFRITSNAMINACSEFHDLAAVQGKRWQKLLQQEHEQRLKLEEMVEQLAKDQISLEKKARMSVITAKADGQRDSIPSDEEDFYDALDHQVEKEFDVALPHSKDKHHRRTGSDLSMESYANDLSSESESEGSVNEARVYTTKANSPKKGLQRQGSGRRDHKRTGSQDKIRMSRSLPDSQNAEGSLVPRRQRRKWIPEKPNISLNLWSVMKNCIGKELSKIPMPVNFNEPLSMLQRLTEELEYSEILDQAALCEDSCEQLAYVAAFTVSAYATTLFRTGKPFNPLLGETFEFDRTEDFGWKSLAEQVSHHPPTLATHTDGRGWTLWQEFTMTTKFRGRYLQIIPMGIAHLTFTKSGGHYTWRKVTTTVHNIIVGRLWVDNQGEMDITNHITGDRCHLKYSAYSYFSRETPRKVTGVVTDSKDNARWVLTGNWCTKMEGAPIIHVEESNKGKPVFETGPHKLLWKVRPPPNGAERIYFFSQLAIEMNEPEEGVAPTDSRNRPDQRLMEEGKWDEANHMKILLEEKQRAARRQREQEIEKAKNEDFDGEYQVDSIRKVTSSSQIDIPFPEGFSVDEYQDEGVSAVRNTNQTISPLPEGREIKPYHPTWFKKEIDSITGNLMHVFTHKYWDSKIKQQWDMCPDIFL